MKLRDCFTADVYARSPRRYSCCSLLKKMISNPGCRIGKNVTIYNGVTLGARTLKAIDRNKDDDSRYPVIEDGVTIFSGAKILGPVTIGKNSIVGVNPVVIDSFPEKSIVAGSLAKLVGKR